MMIEKEGSKKAVRGEDTRGDSGARSAYGMVQARGGEEAW